MIQISVKKKQKRTRHRIFKQTKILFISKIKICLTVEYNFRNRYKSLKHHEKAIFGS